MRAKKHLGQNFLTSHIVARDMVTAAKISKDDTIVEIGPGKGFLTKELFNFAKKVIAIEKDSELIPKLKEISISETAAVKNKKLEIIEGDILEEETLKKLTIEDGSYKLVANIPYYITGQILRLFLSGEKKPLSMTLMLQKEVVSRIVANDKKESVLSLSVKAYGIPRYIKKVPARYFSPKPKVDSAILHIENISKNHFSSNEEENLFFNIIKAGFAHKRKFLSRNLETLFDKEIIKRLFTSCEIPNKTRAEDIPLEKWLCLTKSVKQPLT
jgi:16S rRNA (adenine1518-N6/adenine1519-N6)-dimethyltransferase